jgi:hypothetical protein
MTGANKVKGYTTHKVTTEIVPFNMPNFVFLGSRGGPGIPVGDLTDEDASGYWDWMKDQWLEHVRERRKALHK